MKASSSKSKGRGRTLNAKTRRFVAEYLKDFNGAQAAIRAGYSPASARFAASKMLANVAVSGAVHKGLERVLGSCEISVERAVRQLAIIAFFDPASLFDGAGRLLPIHQLPVEARHGLAQIEVTESHIGGSDGESARVQKVRYGGKVAAIIALMKYLFHFERNLERDDFADIDLGPLVDEQADDDGLSADDTNEAENDALPEDQEQNAPLE
jgi:phage terminase small subunit